MLIDTSGLVCFANAEVSHHDDAKAFFASAPLRLTHSYVLAEYIAVSNARRFDRNKALEFSRKLIESPLTEVIFVDESLHTSAMELLESRSDKTWSLCDAVSFVLMDDRNIREALTTDHHFEQAGFIRLLEP